MKLTERDIRLIRDVGLSHVLSRDQLIDLCYFSSVSRCNRTTRRLRDADLLSVFETPFFGQQLYIAGRRAKDVIGERIAKLLAWRSASPRFIQHALTVTETRIALDRWGYTGWRFEPQLRHEFVWGGRTVDVRPDGFMLLGRCPVFVEVDLGHVAHAKFARKLRSYDAYFQSGAFGLAYGSSPFNVLTVTTGSLRRSRLVSLCPSSTVNFQIQTFEELGIRTPGGWS